jgi:acetolactate synthase-1/2/3 large subunit
VTTDFHANTAAEQLLYLLGAYGIEHLFLNPGTDSAPLQEAMKTLPAAGVAIPHIHSSTFESVSLAAAHAYYQATGRPQCVFVHVDAGTQNLGAIVHDVYRDRAGVVVIAGVTPYGEDAAVPGGRSGYIQWIQDVPDQAGIIRGYAKSVVEITRPEMMDRAVGRAVQLATSYPAGIAYLTIARDVLMDAPVDRELRISGYTVPAAAAMSSASTAEIVSLLAEAERPLLITSRVGRTKEGFETTTALAELAGITVIRGAETGPVSIPTLHPMHLRSADRTSEAIRTADVIAIVESDVPYVPRWVEPNTDATVILIDPDPLKASMPLWSFRSDLSVTADGPTALRQILDGLEALAAESPTHAQRFAQRRELAGTGEPLAEPVVPESGRIGIDEVFGALNSVIAPEDIVVEEAITNDRALYGSLIRTLPNTIAGAFAPGLGWALGGAVGVKLAHQDRRVIAVCGDGSFLFGVPASALMMSAEMACPILVVILNNGGYRASRLPVYEMFPEGLSSHASEAVGTRFAEPPDFAALAVACHAYGERVDRREDLLLALERGLRAVDSGQSAVIDIGIEQN